MQRTQLAYKPHHCLDIVSHHVMYYFNTMYYFYPRGGIVFEMQ